MRGPLTPQEQKEHAEMQELKALLFPAPKPARPEADTPAPQEVLGVETAALEAEEKACAALPKMVFAEDRTASRSRKRPDRSRPSRSAFLGRATTKPRLRPPRGRHRPAWTTA